jgi:hypothetical protein
MSGVILVCGSEGRGGKTGRNEDSLGGGGGEDLGWCVVLCCVGYVFTMGINYRLTYFNNPVYFIIL